MPRTTIRTDDVNAAADIAQSKLATIAADALSGNMIDGGTISNFASTGIDDNADATAITIDSAENVGIGTVTPDTKFHVEGATDTTITVKSTTASSLSRVYLGTDNADNAAYLINYGSGHGNANKFAIKNGWGDIFFAPGASGTATEKMSLTASGNIVMSGYGGIGNYLATMGDDTVTSITPTLNRGIIFVGSNSTHFGAGAFVCVNGGGQEAYLLLNSSGTLAFGTGALASGTAGTDGKLNINAANDGKIYFNNRLGGGAGVWYTMVGAMW